MFDAIPEQLDSKNRRFVLADFGKNARQNRYETSFLWLSDAVVALPCLQPVLAYTPLKTAEKRNLFKLFMGDTGLLCGSSMDNVIVFCRGNIERSGKALYLPLYLSLFFETERLPHQLIYEIDLSGLNKKMIA